MKKGTNKKQSLKSVQASETLDALMALDKLKEILDPRSGGSIDIVTLSADDFNKLINLFVSIKRDPTFGCGQSGLEKTKNLEKKLEAVWLYIGFSLYVHHWLPDRKTTEKDKKNSLIRGIDSEMAPFIADTLKNINNMKIYYYEGYTKISFHQKILQVEGNLFAFLRNLAKNSRFDFENIISELPLFIKRDRLRVSADRAQIRKKKGVSGSEMDVNHKLLGQFPKNGLLAPLKKKLEDTYVDFETGLELDLPLEGKITIETDGKHHLVDNKHSMTHNIKSFLLREKGWIRFSIMVNDRKVREAAFVSNFLCLPPVRDFVVRYKKIMDFRSKLRNKVISLQSEMMNQRGSKDKASLYFSYLGKLLKIDQNINTIVQDRTLERLLQRDDSRKLIHNLIIKSNQISSLKKSLNEDNDNKNRLQSLINDARGSIIELDIEIKDCKAEISKLENKRKFYNKEIIRLNIVAANEFSEYRSNIGIKLLMSK